MGPQVPESPVQGRGLCPELLCQPPEGFCLSEVLSPTGPGCPTLLTVASDLVPHYPSVGVPAPPPPPAKIRQKLKQISSQIN